MRDLRTEDWADLIGKPYTQANDCWGITKIVFARRGIVVTEPGVAALDTSGNIVGAWRKLPAGQEEAGDVASWATQGKGIDHVAVLLGDGKHLHAMKGQRACATFAAHPGFIGYFRPLKQHPDPEMVANRDCGRVNCRYAQDFHRPHETSPYVCPAGQTAAEMLPAGMTAEDVFVSVHGMRIESPETYRPRAGDVVLFVQKPKGAFLAAAIIGGGTTAATLTTGGLILAFAINAVISIGLGFLVSLLSAPTQVDREQGPADDSPTFNLGGIRNTIAPGGTVGIVIGEHRFGGQIIGLYNSISDLDIHPGASLPCAPTGSFCLPAPPMPLTTPSFGPDSFVTSYANVPVSGGKTALNVLISLGEGPVQSVNGLTEDTDELDSSFLGDGTLLIDGADASDYQNVKVSVRLGEAEQGVVPGFGQTINSFAQSTEMTKDTVFAYETTENVEGFELQLFEAQGHYEVGLNSGNVNHKRAEYTFRWKPKGATAWTQNITIARDYVNRGAHSWAINRDNLPTAIYEIELVRTTLNDDDPAVDPGESSMAEMTAVNEIRDFAQDYGSIALVAVKAIGSEQLSGSPTFTNKVEGHKFWVWDGVSETAPVFARQYTRNPGEILPGLMLNKVYSTGHRIDLEDVKLSEFATLATHCDESIDDGRGGLMSRYRFDYVHDKSERTGGLIDKILATCNSKLAARDNQIGAWTDKTETPSHLFSEGNVSELKVSYLTTDGRATKTNVSFLNKEIDYDFDSESFENQTATADQLEEESVEIRGITKPARAKRMAKRRQNIAQLVKKSVEFKAPVESVALQPGDLFWLTTIALSTKMVSGRLARTAAANVAIYLDEEVVLESATTYAFTISSIRDGAAYQWTSTVTSPAGTYPADTSIAVVDMGFHGGQLPQKGDTYAFGIEAEYMEAYRCLECPMDGELQRAIKGIEYNVGVYDDDPGEVAQSTDLFPSDRTIPANVTGLKLSEETRTLQSGDLNHVVVASWVAEHSWQRADVFVSEQSGGIDFWQYVGRTGSASIEIGKFAQGSTIRVSVCPLSPKGTRKPPAAGSMAWRTIIGKLDGPAVVTNFRVEDHPGGIVLTWDDPDDTDLGQIEFRQGDQWLGAQHVAWAVKGSCLVSIPFLLIPTMAYTFIARTINTSGRESDATVTATLTPAAPLTETSRTKEHTLGWLGTKTGLTISGSDLISDAAATDLIYESGNVDAGSKSDYTPMASFELHWVSRAAEPGAPTLGDLTDNFRTLMTTSAEDSTITPASDLGALLTPFGLVLGDHYRTQLQRKTANTESGLVGADWLDHKPGSLNFQWIKWRIRITLPGDDFKVYVSEFTHGIYETPTSIPDVLTTKGDILHYSGGYKRLASGGADTYLRSDGAGILSYAKIPTAGINNAAITTALVADDNVTRSKIASSSRSEKVIELQGWRSGSWTAGQSIPIFIITTNKYCRLRVPLGKTLEVLNISMMMQNGSSASEYFYSGGLAEFQNDQSQTITTYHHAAVSSDSGWSHTGASERVYPEKEWDGATPLASVTGGAAVSVMPFIENESGSPGTTTSANVQITIRARLV